MQDLPLNIYSVDTVREIDRTAIEVAGISGYVLMSRAGAAALALVINRYPAARRWQVFCGAGNNGGDGYVVARLAAAAGIRVTVTSLSEPESLQGDAAKAYAAYIAAGGRVSPWNGSVDPEADLLVDGMLGSGLTRDVTGEYAAAVAAINAADATVLALDIPTGIHGDSGEILGCAVRADATISFVGLKAGLFLDEGRACSGQVAFSDLDIGDECYAGKQAVFRRIDRQRIRDLLPRRPRTSHKGNFGHVLAVGGDEGMPGAILLCGEGALRAGAGRVSTATHPSHAATIVKSRPELMSHAISDTSDLDALLEAADVLAFGPGLGQSQWSDALYKKLQAYSAPAVWDADALNHLARSPAAAANRIITPHPGEAATLLGVSARDIQRDRSAAVSALKERYGGTVVLKGAGTLVSSAAGVPWLCTDGNPGMAAPGMGDVLTGIIAGFLAQGLAIEDAAIAGVEVHAQAGDRAAQTGERGLIASDLLDAVREVVNE